MHIGQLLLRNYNHLGGIYKNPIQADFENLLFLETLLKWPGIGVHQKRLQYPFIVHCAFFYVEFIAIAPFLHRFLRLATKDAKNHPNQLKFNNHCKML